MITSKVRHAADIDCLCRRVQMVEKRGERVVLASRGYPFDLVRSVKADPVSVVKDISINVSCGVTRTSLKSNRTHQRKSGECFRIVSASTSVLTVVTEHFDAALQG